MTDWDVVTLATVSSVHRSGRGGTWPFRRIGVVRPTRAIRLPKWCRLRGRSRKCSEKGRVLTEVHVQSPRLSYCESPSSFSAAGYFFGFKPFWPYHNGSNGV